VLAELQTAGLIVLADKGYQGSAYAKIPYRGKNKPEAQKAVNRAHAKLRSPGERANAQLKTSSRPGASSASSAAAPGAQASSPKPSTYCKSARSKQDEDSLPSLGDLRRAGWRAALLQPADDDGCSLGGLRGLVAAAVFDEERWLAAIGGVQLDEVETVLAADEVDIVVIGSVHDPQPFDDHARYSFPQLVENVIDRSTGPVRSAPRATPVHEHQASPMAQTGAYSSSAPASNPYRSQAENGSVPRCSPAFGSG